MSVSLVVLAAIMAPPIANAQVTVEQRDDGWRLLVDGQPFVVKGVNWGYIPVGTNHSYSLWAQPEPVVRGVLDQDGALLRDAGANTVRIMQAQVPPQRIEYLYEQYGIHTIVNHTLGRYGLMIDGQWVTPTDYSDPATRALILDDVRAFAERYRGVPGVLAYALGNENNYGLEWSSTEIEDLPEGEQQRAKAAQLYSLFEEAFALIKSIDDSRPTILVNGDLHYLDLIAEQCPSMDILGTNVYRGRTFTDLYDTAAVQLGKPVLLVEFGCDAYNAAAQAEDQQSQAEFLLAQWRDIYRNLPGHGGAGNALGGTVFQWNDGWWKFGQEYDLDVHNTDASWSNIPYDFDYSEDRGNMNEEWWGVTAKGDINEAGVEQRVPRRAYHVLGQVWRLDPLVLEPDQLNTSLDAIAASIDQTP